MIARMRAVAKRRIRGGLAVAVIGVLAGLVGCDTGSEGPGTLRASLELASGGSPGSALLIVQGSGIRSVEGTGGTQSWSAPYLGSGSGVRVLLMDPDPEGAMTFEVGVAELSAPLPVVTVYQLAGRNNVRLPTSTEVDVSFER